ncbi:MAG: L-ribulose-5-phosphate 4-epimerase [Armatimonadetes bacterium]|nr:L-ribulose-5-phosphate 4-epimerase [Armatimonadota bacterium]
MLEELKARVCEANLELKRSGLVILTWGNVSGIDRDSGLVAIKPSGVSYEDMRPEHMVIVDLEGRVVEGEMRPSSDKLTHLVLYRDFPEIGGVAHTHSTYATAWAQACRPLPCYGTTHADNFRGEIPVTKRLSKKQLQGQYEFETGVAIVRAMEGLDPLHIPAVLVANHGPFTWGDSPGAAVENSIVLEQVAEMAWVSERLRTVYGDRFLKPIGRELQDKHFLRKHGKDAYYGQ